MPAPNAVEPLIERVEVSIGHRAGIEALLERIEIECGDRLADAAGFRGMRMTPAVTGMRGVRQRAHAPAPATTAAEDDTLTEQDGKHPLERRSADDLGSRRSALPADSHPAAPFYGTGPNSRASTAAQMA